VARNPERDFGEARERLDRGDHIGALRSLDRARRGFARRGDVDGLRHVLDLATLVETADERTAAERDNVVYAAKQNLRQATRTRAVRERSEWIDPYPDIEAPAAPRARVYFTRWVKLAIAIGVLAGVLALGGCIALFAIYSAEELSVGVVNDGQRPVTVRWCGAPDCDDQYESHEVFPNGTAEFDLPSDDRLDLIVVTDMSGRRVGCFVVPVHSTYEEVHPDARGVSFAVSQADPCPR
jgi:hypothetical protein